MISGNNRPPSKRLFVGSLPYKTTEGELLSLFVTEGKVVAVRIIHNRWGRSRGMGYIEYENVADAVRAKEKYHNYQMGDRTIIVDFAQPDPFLTPEGQQRWQQTQANRKSRRPPSAPSRPSSANTLPQARGFKPARKSGSKKVRQSVYDQRNYGARIGAKFASRTKKKRNKH